jgi:hypothetical protein
MLVQQIDPVKDELTLVGKKPSANANVRKTAEKAQAFGLSEKFFLFRVGLATNLFHSFQ